MTVTLCIETSSAHCSVALRVNGQNYAQHQLLHRKHNERVLEMLEQLFSQAHCTPRQVDVVGFGCGPGSFTGVRIAAAVTQAISYAAGAKVVAMPGSQVWLASALRTAEAALRPNWVTCIPSRGQAYYLSHLRPHRQKKESSAAGVEIVRADVLVEEAPEWLLALGGDEHPSDDLYHVLGLVGQRPDWLPVQFAKCWVDGVEPVAQAMLEYVTSQHEAGLSGRPEQALPNYVAGDSPWKKSADRSTLQASISKN